MTQKAVIISCGDELTNGATIDTNSAFLSRRLRELGVAVIRHVTVGDDLERLALAIAAAADEASIVILTGGLGPTLDDVSRQALAAAMGNLPLVEDAHSLERISRFFVKINRPMTPSNRTQALLPAGAEALDNDWGTAPGIAAQVKNARVFVLPGPPHEMTPMFERLVAPRLGGGGAIAYRTLHCFGQGESAIGEQLADLMHRDQAIRVGTTASGGIISVRIAAGGADDAQAAASAQAVADDVRRRLGDLIFGQEGQSLSAVVGGLLRQADQRLAVAESCTGGLVGQLITAVAGASDYFLGGVISYADQLKGKLLGVTEEMLSRHGAVSQPVATAMAEGAAKLTGADWALAVTGIAGPGGGSEEKPVGLVYIALAGPAGTSAWRYVFPGDRDMVRLRCALSAINHLRLALLAEAHKSG